MDTELTLAVTVLPSTLWPLAVAMAWLPRFKAAGVASRASLMAPAFSVRAPAATSMPSGSASAACTV